MDIEQFSEFMISVGWEMEELAGELYGATIDPLPKAELDPLITQGETLLRRYYRVKRKSKGGKLRELEEYEEVMEQISQYIKGLKVNS